MQAKHQTPALDIVSSVTSTSHQKVFTFPAPSFLSTLKAKRAESTSSAYFLFPLIIVLIRSIAQNGCAQYIKYRLCKCF